ncbi:MAG: phosphatidylglycerol lysyltransferase domain-containing protein [Gemmatimonadaceae bacterium]
MRLFHLDSWRGDVLQLAKFEAGSPFQKARELILELGWNATAYQILNPGIELWFPNARDGVVGFVRHRRMRVVAGAPVCDLRRLDAIVAEFVADAHRCDERVCYFGAGERLESLYESVPGWSFVLLGAQPAWDPRDWPAVVAKRASLRAQFNRARNKGISVKEWSALKAENHPALRRCLQEWLTTRHLPPLHFLVEPETLSHLRDRRVFVAERNDGELVAFTVLSPVPARSGWLVEQIVRGRHAPNGTAELLIDNAMREIATTGATYATLGLSPLSQRAGQPPITQPLWLRVVLRWVRLHGARFYNFAGLDAFKAKFNPQSWEPIYAIAEGNSFPPSALYAIAGAFSGGAPITLVLVALLRALREEAQRFGARLTASARATRR